MVFVFVVLLKPKRNLPANIWFPVHRALFCGRCCDVKCTAHTTLEIGAIVKNTSAFIGGCDVTAVLFFAEPFVIFATLEILPVLWC
jgi:hypothetical protein